MKSITCETPYLTLEVKDRGADRAFSSERYYSYITSKRCSPQQCVYIEESDLITLGNLFSSIKAL
jgi:hypothetical protein